MNTTRFVIFLVIVLTVHTAVNAYIFVRGWQALPRIQSVRIAYAAVFLVLYLSFTAGRVLEKISVCRASEALIWIGSFWLACMLYFVIALLFVDLTRLADRAFHFLPAPGTPAAGMMGVLVPAAVVALVASLVSWGYVSACRPVRRTLELAVERPAGTMKSLKIAFVSDIHLGTIVKNSRLQRMVDMISAIGPDIVLLGGDIVDEDIAPVIERNMGEQLRTIKARLGVYAVTGNHEYIGGVEKACRYLEEHGITVLRDRAVTVGGAFRLAGREDNSITGFTGRKRKSIEEILAGTDPALPVVLMDHQPLNPRGAAAAGVDLQLSGHTHDGQLWPITFVTRRVFEISRGHHVLGKTHIFVSNGYGTWGPPVRVGAVPEVVEIRLTFGKGGGR